MNLHVACSLRWALCPTDPLVSPSPTTPWFWLVSLRERGLGPQSFYRRGPSRDDPSVTRDALSAPEGWAQSPWLLLTKPRSAAAGVVAAPDLHLCLPPTVWSAPQGGGR